MEGARNTNASAAESVMRTASDTYIGDVNVITLSQRNTPKFNASICEVERFQSETTSLLPEVTCNDQIKYPKVAVAVTDVSENNEVDRNIFTSIEDKAPGKAESECDGDGNEIITKYTDTYNNLRYFGGRTMFAKEEASSIGQAQTAPRIDEQRFGTRNLVTIGDISSDVEGITENGISNETGTRFLNELYVKEVDIERNFSDQEILDIRTAVDQQVIWLTETICEIDHRFRIREVILVGSAQEGTQIVRPCEYDYILVLYALSKSGAVSITVPKKYLKQASLEFVHVKLENIELRSLFHESINKHEEIMASGFIPWKGKKGLRGLFNEAVAWAVKRCANKSVEKKSGNLTYKDSKPEQHGPACTVMFEWHRKSSGPPMKISVDLCQALKMFWEVYENMFNTIKWLQCTICFEKSYSKCKISIAHAT